MNQQDLTQHLSIANGTLTIANDTLGTQFGSFLSAYNGGQPLVITQAVQSSDQTAGSAVVISGVATFANVANLPVTATFSVDSTGNVQAQLRYQLRATMPGANPWIFSRSFPKLPTEYDSSTATARVYLDTLNLFDSYFVVSTAAAQDPVFNVPLSVGINFVSHMRPQGTLGILENMAGADLVVTLYGVIRLPALGTTTVTAPLQPMEQAWNRLNSSAAAPAPGIYLQAALGLGFQLGKLDLQKTCLRIFSPISTDWLQQNTSFAPVHGYTATLSIPSASLQMDLDANMGMGVNQTMLYCNLSGFTLGKLAHLLDLAGTDSLLSQLPSDLQHAVDGLDHLELQFVGLDLVLTKGLPYVRTAFVTVGFPNLNWHIWKNDLVVESLSCRFMVRSPFFPTKSGPFATSIVATVLGTVDVEGAVLAVSAASDDHFIVRARTVQPLNIALDKLVKAHGPGVPVPSALTVNYLAVTAAMGRYYSMDAQLGDAPTPWVIAVGKNKLAISNVVLSFTVPASGSVTGAFSGNVAFAGANLQFTYDIPGSFVLRGKLPPMKLSQVIDELCDQKVKLPGGFDLDLDTASILIQDVQGNLTFQLCAQVRGLGIVAFQAQGGGEKPWGFAFGVDLASSTPSALPGFSALAALEKALHLEKFLFAVSTIDQPGFQLPDAAAFTAPQLGNAKVALPGSGGISSGINVFAQWTLDASDKKQNLLKALLGLQGTESVTIQVGEDPAVNSKLFFSNAGKLHGHPFSYKVGAMLTSGTPSFFLTGSVTAAIQNQPQTFDVTTVFVPTGAFISADMKGAKPVDCKYFQLSNLGLVAGVDWAGIPSLGITATIDVKNFESSIAVFFDSADPSKSLIAGAVSNLTLKDVVDTLIGSHDKSSIDDILSSVAITGTSQFTLPASTATALAQSDLAAVSSAFAAAKVQIPNASSSLLLSAGSDGKTWHLTDLTMMRHYQLQQQNNQIVVSLEPQFYFAPQATVIGTINFPMGFYINAGLDILGYHAAATVSMSGNQGISVDATMDAIHLGSNNLFAITSADGKSGPKLSISTMAQPSNPVAQFRTPHLYISGAAHLLGLSAELLVSCTTQGLELQMQGPLAPMVEFDLTVQAGRSALAVDGGIKAGVGSIDLGTLGKVNLDTDIEGSLGIRLSGAQLQTAVEAGYEFLGEKKELARFSLDTTPDALTHLGDKLKSLVADMLRDEFKDMNKWTDAMKKGVVSGVSDVSHVYQSVYGKSAKDADAAAHELSGAASSAGHALSSEASSAGHAVSGEASSAGHSLSSGAKSAGRTFKKLF